VLKRIAPFILIIVLSLVGTSALLADESQLSCSLNVTVGDHGNVTADMSWSGATNWLVLFWGDGQDKGSTDESGKGTYPHQYDIDNLPDGSSFTITVRQLDQDQPCATWEPVSWKKVTQPDGTVTYTVVSAPAPEFYDCVLSNKPMGLDDKKAVDLLLYGNENMVRVTDGGQTITIGPLRESFFGKTMQLFWRGGGGSAMFELNKKGDCQYVTQ
jgi:hypothetical protein